MVNFTSRLVECFLYIGNTVVQLQNHVAETFQSDGSHFANAVNVGDGRLKLLADAVFDFCGRGAGKGNGDQYDFQVEGREDFSTHNDHRNRTDDQ